MSKDKVLKKYLDYSWKTFYESYFQELASEFICKKWERIEVMISILVAITASGSAISGLALWSKPGFKFLWAVIAFVSMLASIVYKSFKIPGRIKAQAGINSKFAKLRIDVDTFRQQLHLGIQDDKREEKYNDIRERFSHSIENTMKDIFYTLKFSEKVQEYLNKILKKEGYIK